MSTERTVVIVCDDAGQHGPRVLAELALRDGAAVDLRLAGRERLRQAYAEPVAAAFDRRCKSCGRNPRASAEGLTSIVTTVLGATSEQRFRLNISREGASLF